MLKTHEDCIAYLETIRWNGKPICPYCGFDRATKYKNERRYRCNGCFTSYSVTVGTVFHHTHVDLRKWFQAILLLCKLDRNISVRKLARELQVNRATATLMVDRILKVSPEEAEVLQMIIHAIEQVS